MAAFMIDSRNDSIDRLYLAPDSRKKFMDLAKRFFSVKYKKKSSLNAIP